MLVFPRRPPYHLRPMNNPTPWRYQPNRSFSPAAMLLRGALFAFLHPQLRILGLTLSAAHSMGLLDDVLIDPASASYYRARLIHELDRATGWRLPDDVRDGLRNMLSALEPEIARANWVTLTVAWDAERDTA